MPTVKTACWAYPNFLIIGAMKSGTTPLYDFLGQHPQVFMPRRKEPHFFSSISQGESFQFEGDREVISCPDRFQALFAPKPEQTAVGEASTSYLCTPGTAKAIYDHLPHAKLICVLRNPVERAYSHYLFLRGHGIESLDNFAQALAAEPARHQAGQTWGRYFQVGLYAAQLRPYLERFARRQIAIYLFDELRQNPVDFAQEVYRFLGIDDTFVPDTSIRRNPGGIPKSDLLNALLVRPNPIKQFIQPHLPRWLYRAATHLRDQNLSKPPMAAETRQHLIAAYREDILQLQDLIGRDLGNWLH